MESFLTNTYSYTKSQYGTLTNGLPTADIEIEYTKGLFYDTRNKYFPYYLAHPLRRFFASTMDQRLMSKVFPGYETILSDRKTKYYRLEFLTSYLGNMLGTTDRDHIGKHLADYISNTPTCMKTAIDDIIFAFFEYASVGSNMFCPRLRTLIYSDTRIIGSDQLLVTSGASNTLTLLYGLFLDSDYRLDMSVDMLKAEVDPKRFTLFIHPQFESLITALDTKYNTSLRGYVIPWLSEAQRNNVNIVEDDKAFEKTHITFNNLYGGKEKTFLTVNAIQQEFVAEVKDSFIKDYAKSPEETADELMDMLLGTSEESPVVGSSASAFSLTDNGEEVWMESITNDEEEV